MALASPAWRELAPWRVHFHVPVFRETAAGSLATTRSFLERVLARVAAGGVTDHLEIETYTWDVLPEAERRDGSGFDLVEALAREYESVLASLEAHGATREGGGMTASADANAQCILFVVSDRAARGERADQTADLLRPLLADAGFDLVDVVVVPDERELLADALREACDRAGLVLTTGGTGVAARDVTPEATRDVLEVEIPGFAEEMRRRSLETTPKALGSRAVAGARGRAVVLNLPGAAHRGGGVPGVRPGRPAAPGGAAAGGGRGRVPRARGGIAGDPRPSLSRTMGCSLGGDRRCPGTRCDVSPCCCSCPCSRWRARAVSAP